MSGDLAGGGAVALAVRSTGYALEGLAEVTDADLDRPTPCPGWDVRALLLHLADSADGLAGLALTGEFRPPTPRRSGDAHPVAVAEDRLLHLLDVLTTASSGDRTAGWAEEAARNGAIEVGVHGWDLARACGSSRAMPPGLAGALLAAASARLDDGARPGLFGAPVDPAPGAGPEERLVAFLGRAREDTAPAPVSPEPASGSPA